MAVEGLVAVFASPDRDGVLDGDYPDATVADFACLSGGYNGIDSLLDIAVANHNREQSPLDAAGVVDDAAVDATLACLADASYVVVREPLDVGGQKGISHIIELGFPDDSFNLFHDYRFYELLIG